MGSLIAHYVQFFSLGCFLTHSLTQYLTDMVAVSSQALVTL